MAASGRAPEIRAGELVMSIGEVYARLLPEFPGITISKLRFLEAEGLVEPLRAPSGFRRYTAAHLERLRLVLTAQRDQYLPLRVIRERIEARDRGDPRALPAPHPRPEPPAVPVPPPTAQRPPQRVRAVHETHEMRAAQETQVTRAMQETAEMRAAQKMQQMQEIREHEMQEMHQAHLMQDRSTAAASVGARLSRTQLQQQSGLSEMALADLERYGLLAADPDGFYDAEALTIAGAAARLADFGLEGRHLRAYRSTTDREVGLLAQLAPALARQIGREQAFATVRELAALCAQLHGALVGQGLRRMLEQ